MEANRSTIQEAPKTGRCRRKNQRSEEILQAALRSFARYGFSGCRIDDIAEDAGVSKGAIYLYFDSKAALFKAVVQEAVVPAFEFRRIENLVATNRQSWGSLLQYVLMRWAEKLSEPEMAPSLRLLVSDAQTIPELAAHCYQQIISPSQRLIEQMLAGGAREAEFSELDQGQVAKALSAPFYLLALWPVDQNQFGRDRSDLRKTIKTAIELQICGLGIRNSIVNSDIRRAIWLSDFD